MLPTGTAIESTAYEYATKYIKISNLMDACMIHNCKRMAITNSIRMHVMNGNIDLLLYDDYPVIDHKGAWGDEAFGYNFVSSKPIERWGKRIAIIFDNRTNIFYHRRDDINEEESMLMDFMNIEEHLFQMELLMNERYDTYCILHALHMLGYDKTTYIHIQPMIVLDEIIDELEKYLVRYSPNKEF